VSLAGVDGALTGSSARADPAGSRHQDADVSFDLRGLRRRSCLYEDQCQGDKGGDGGSVPQPLTDEIPQAKKNFDYVELEVEILIVDRTSKKIVGMFGQQN
jgi:hypothetical protein